MDFHEQQILDAFLNVPNALTLGLVYLTHATLKRIFPKTWRKSSLARAEPALPIAFAFGLQWVPGLATVTTLGPRIAMAVFIGAVAMMGRKVLLQTFLGRDPRIRAALDYFDPPTGPAVPAIDDEPVLPAAVIVPALTIPPPPPPKDEP